MSSQVAEVAAPQAARAAAYAGLLEQTKQMADRYDSFPLKGAFSLALLADMRGLVAAREGRTVDALGAFTEARAALRALGLDYTAAYCGVDAAVLLPGNAAARDLAEQGRPVFERLRARPWLTLLDGVATRHRPVEAGAAGAVTTSARL